MGVARPIKVLDDGAAMVNVKNMETKIMKKKCFVGVDIAKKTFDAVIYEQGTAKASASSYRHFSNDAEGFSGLLSWLTSETGFKTGALVVGMENTGLYGYALCRFLEGERVDYCVFNPLALKRSLGLVRGKDDRVDAFRIARFTYQHRDCLRYSRLSGETVRKLKSLATERARLVRQLAANKAFATDHKSSEGEREQVGRALELAALIQTFIDRVEKDMEDDKHKGHRARQRRRSDCLHGQLQSLRQPKAVRLLYRGGAIPKHIRNIRQGEDKGVKAGHGGHKGQNNAGRTLRNNIR